MSCIVFFVEEDEKSDEDEELDKQMGNLGDAEADKLDERLWGEDEDEEDESGSEDSITETGPGMDEVKTKMNVHSENKVLSRFLIVIHETQACWYKMHRKKKSNNMKCKSLDVIDYMQSPWMQKRRDNLSGVPSMFYLFIYK